VVIPFNKVLVLNVLLPLLGSFLSFVLSLDSSFKLPDSVDEVGNLNILFTFEPIFKPVSNSPIDV
jgi:hypothetical protein